MQLHRIRMKNLVNADTIQNVLQIKNNKDNTIYSIISSIDTTDQGALGFNISYVGGDFAHMYASQWINNMKYIYHYDFATSMFTKVLKKALHYNIKQLNYKCIYNSNIDIIGLVNKVIQYGTLTKQ